jgi:thioester reductase-like protein/predicted lipid carrier protein YhbT
LVRNAPGTTAEERVAELLDFWAEVLGRRLPAPVVLNGDLTSPGLGLGAADRRWLAGHCQAVVHAAANVSYQETPGGEVWETNVNGTRHLLELCRPLGITAVHHLSTAFVCGDRHGLVREDELDCGGGPINAYERSKFVAEQMVLQAPGIRATVYRPSVIIGDSHTGYTSTYHHFYRFLELAIRLSKPIGAARRYLSLRLPLTGAETQNLVPVDWVAQAVVQLVHRPRWHGRTFHLAAWQPVCLQEIKTAVEDVLHLEGVEWGWAKRLDNPTSLEELVLEQFCDYWAYLHRSLLFDCRNTRKALPDLPPPSLDRSLVARLLEFALADQWGRGPIRAIPAGCPASPPPLCARYLEEFLPSQVRRSTVARALSLDLAFAFDIRGEDGGQWSCRWEGGELVEVRRGLDTEVVVTYRTDAATFASLIGGRQTPQDAFFAGHIEIAGDMEIGLKLAAVFEQFLAEVPYKPSERTEVLHARGR